MYSIYFIVRASIMEQTNGKYNGKTNGKYPN